MPSRMSVSLAVALSVLSVLTGHARADDYKPPSECIHIEKTTACAPFGHGYYINGTELGLVYGLSGPIPDAHYWDRLVRDITSGGKHQAEMWRNWAQCTGYQGEHIQYYRTYTCMTDIFMFSGGCNKDRKPPAKPICEEACALYGEAVSELIRDEYVCPLSFGDYNQDVYDEVSERRSYALTGAETCQNMLNKMNGDQDYKDNSCYWGVDEDHRSCGFGGDSKIADLYCQDNSQDPCCHRRGKKYDQEPNPKDSYGKDSHAKDSKQETGGKNHAALANPSSAQAQSATSSSSTDSTLSTAADAVNQTFVSKNKTAIIAGSSGAAVLLVVGAAVTVMRARRRRSTDHRRNRIQPGNNGGSVPFIAPVGNMTEATSNVTPLKAKYKVVYDYTPQLIDELELSKGDMVEVWASYDDGWGKGSNMRTGNKGTFPMACIEMIRD